MRSQRTSTLPKVSANMAAVRTTTTEPSVV
jgi:hypothetical protein